MSIYGCINVTKIKEKGAMDLKENGAGSPFCEGGHFFSHFFLLKFIFQKLYITCTKSQDE